MHTPDHIQLRQTIKAQRQALDPATQKQYAQQIAEQLIHTTHFHNSQKLAAYIAVNGECNPQHIINIARNHHKTTYLPIITHNKILKFAACTPDTPMQPNRYGIPEPITPPESWQDADNMDLICVPLVAFDPACNRLGMGGGYYDRTLHKDSGKKRHAQYIGIAYEFQKVDTLQTNRWDIPMDYIITEKKLYSRI